ncbi:MAG: hypothetical protein M1826_003024 [Phylliscum demangeonii]|nr:MAG: hypothetical protein M1826_003024 [Phylliscum demangeonii]
MSDPLPSSSSALHRPRDDDHHDDDHNGEVYQPLFGGGDANQQVLPSPEPTNIEAASPWRADDWRTSDDRVRGGASQSFLTIIEGGRDAGPGAPTPGPPTPPAAAVFHGHLDHHTLGGAGFASQRTAAHGVPGAPWHLGASEGVVLVIERKKKKQVMDDDKMFTFILTDTLPAPEQDPHTGREQAVLLYEYDFRVSTGLAEEGEEEVELEGEVEGEREVVRVYVPFAEMRPTYRGREKSGATPLDRTSVKRVAIMIRR